MMMKNKILIFVVAGLFFFGFIFFLFNNQKNTFSPSKTYPTLKSIPSNVFKIAIIGDYGLAGRPEKKVADVVKSWKPDAILTVGDNNYPIGAANTLDQNIGQYYGEYILKHKFYPSPGNHDLGDLKSYIKYFSLYCYECLYKTSVPGQGRYYDFTLGQIHFFALNSNPDEPDGVSQDSKQATWLKNKLQTVQEKYKIVYFHHPPFSSGTTHGSTKYMQWPFKEWGVTAVLSGHEHNYERIIKNRLPYFVDGLGGYPARYSFGKPIDGSQVRYNDDYGAMLIKVVNNQMIFQFINSNNKIIDNYTVSIN